MGGQPAGELTHAYGGRVHVLDSAWVHTALARISSPDVRLTELFGLVRSVYRVLLWTAGGRELAVTGAELPTRMAEVHPGHGVWRGEVIDPAQDVVVVDVIRGGILPSQACFEELLTVLSPERVRLDHLNMQRTADEAGRVTGVDLSGSKVGGSVEGATLVIPDPMGATGSTVLGALDHYAADHGRPARVLLLPMIATPEFLRAVTPRPEVVVWAGRLDRGLSDPDVLATVPGTFWDRERGLDDRGYIVPGAGGVGEVLSNSWC